VGAADQRQEPVAVAFEDGVADRRQRRQGGANRERRAPLIVERRDDAVILELELLVEGEARQRALLNDREGSQDPAGDGDKE
jgi:hypothetical protein